MKKKRKNSATITHVKTVRKADREIALENNTFHLWLEKPKVTKNKKKYADKMESRNFKKNKY